MNMGHASVDLLAAYASGSLPEGMSLLVASHLTYCPACRNIVTRIECVGGALLCVCEAAPPAPDCLARAMARIDAGEGEEAGAGAAPDEAGGPLPLPLRRRLGKRMDQIRWRFLMPGLHEHRLDGFGEEEVKLVRARPGVRIPQHTHVGEEGTLVLAGQMQDGGQIFGPGDLSLADETDDHTPRIVGTETCFCLAVFSGPMRFTGRLGRALNFFT